MDELPVVPNDQPGLINDERSEGVMIDREGSSEMALTDAEFSQIVSGRMGAAISYWNDKLNLDDNRAAGERYYKNESYKEDELHEFQTPYKDNRIIIDVESLASLIVSSPAEPIVTEANDTDASRQLAMDLGNVLMAFYEDQTMKAKLTKVARHLLMGKRIGVMKYWFDPSKGKILPDGSRKGAIIFEVRRPEKIVIAEATGPGENPLFIGEYLSATIEELTHKFPKKKDEIFKDQGIQRGTKKQLQQVVGYIEYHFTYYTKDGEVREGIGWKLNKITLGKIDTPNWNYDGYEVNEVTGNAASLNFFEYPQKPYIFFTHLDTDEYLLDETALIDHAIPLQDVLNKRGRQIVENADAAVGGLVYNTGMITESDMSKLTGDPTEKIGVDGPVGEAVARLPHNVLPSFVMQDKFDARAEIDNIFGANAPIKGEQSGIDTLGQEILSQRANMGRAQPLADTIEDGMDKVYKARVQMMKVWWDEPESVRFTNSQGATTFLNWSGDKIEDGVGIRVKAGSALPKDKFALRNETIQSIAILDPLSIAEGLDKADPMGFAKRILFYRFFMDRYLSEVLGEGAGGVDQQAAADIQALIGGEVPPVPDDVSKAYLATFDQFLRSDGFKQLEPDIKTKIMDFLIAASDRAKQAMGEEPGEGQQLEQGGEPEANAEAPVAQEGGQVQEQGGNIFSRGINKVREKIGI